MFKIDIVGNNIELGREFRNLVRKNINTEIGKFLDDSQISSANVYVSKDAELFKINILLNALSRQFTSSDIDEDAHKALTLSVSHLAKQIRRLKRKFNDKKRTN